MRPTRPRDFREEAAFKTWYCKKCYRRDCGEPHYVRLDDRSLACSRYRNAIAMGRG